MEIIVLIATALTVIVGTMVGIASASRVTSGPDGKCVICRQSRCENHCPNSDR